MGIIKTVRGKTPVLGEDCFIAEDAVIIGDTIIGDHCSIWYGAVIRGDVNSIKIGNNVNVQDNAVIHATYEKSKTTIGNNVSIEYGAVVHGSTIHDNVQIGINSVILDDAIISSNAIIAAGAVTYRFLDLHDRAAEVYGILP
jgi:carbonic anhydrase/acetyltransferase-like protein (isoleucine patch superfamily)